MFYEAYQNDPEITILENPYYLDGNNITSMYVARDYLDGAFVLEGDLLISNDSVFKSTVMKSGYCASWMHEVPEWALDVKDERINACNIGGGVDAYRLWGISMWTKEDGEKLSEIIRYYMEELKDWSIYWDELVLDKCKDQFNLGIREINSNDIIEIDTIEELKSIDSSYMFI